MERIIISEEENRNIHSNKVCYLPHHAVFKESSTSTKLRVVFDASMSTSTGQSLNDCMLVGPRLQEDIFDINLRWRKHRRHRENVSANIRSPR